MALFEFAISTFTRSREDGTTRQYKVTFERELAAAPAEVDTVPVVDEIVITQGGSGNEVNKAVIPTVMSMNLQGVASENALLAALKDADPDEFRVKVEDALSGFEWFYGKMVPEISEFDIYEPVKYFNVKAICGLSDTGEAIQIEGTGRKTFDTIADDVNTTVGIDRPKEFILDFRHNGQAKSDLIPNLLRVPTMAGENNVAGSMKEPKVYNELEGFCRAFGLRVFVSEGRLKFAELNEIFEGAATANAFVDSGAGYVNTSRDLVRSFTKASVLKENGFKNAQNVKRVVNQFKPIVRKPVSNLTAASGGLATSANPVENYGNGVYLKGGDILDFAEATLRVNLSGNFAGTMNLAELKIENEAGADIWWDFDAQAWVDAQFQIEQTVAALSGETFKDYTVGSFITPPVPDNVVGELKLLVKRDITRTDSGSAANVDSVEYEFLNLDFELPDLTDSPVYSKWTAEPAASDKGRVIAQAISVSDVNPFTDSGIQWLDGGLWEETTTWVDADGNGAHGEVLGRRIGKILAGKKKEFRFTVRDGDFIDLATHIKLTDDDAVEHACLPVKVEHSLLAGYYELYCLSVPDAVTSESFTYSLFETESTEGGVSNATQGSSNGSGPGGTGSIDVSDQIQEYLAGIQALANDPVQVANPTLDTDFTISLSLSGNLRVTAGNLDTIQGIRTIDSPTFAGLTVNGNGTFSGNVTGANLNISNWNTAYTHVSASNNPHSVTKAQVGLSNVTNDLQVPASGGTFTGAIQSPSHLLKGTEPILKIEETDHVDNNVWLRLVDGILGIEERNDNGTLASTLGQINANNNNLVWNGGATFSGNVGIGTNLTVTGDGSFANLTVGGLLSTGSLSISGNISATSASNTPLTVVSTNATTGISFIDDSGSGTLTYLGLTNKFNFSAPLEVGGELVWHAGNSDAFDNTGTYANVTVGNSNNLDGWSSTSFMFSERGGDISSNSVLDDNTFANGAYRVNSGLSSAPGNDFYSLLRYGNKNNVVGQLATNYVTGETYTRAYNTSWTAWRTLWDSENLTSVSQLNNDEGYYSSGSNVTFGSGSFSSPVTVKGSFNTGSTATSRTKAYETFRVEATNSAGSSPYRGFGPALDFYSRNYDGGTIRPNARIVGSISNLSSSDTGGELRFFTTATDTAVDEDDFLERMKIASNGNVGIGTTLPQKTLHVSNSTYDNQILIQRGIEYGHIGIGSQNLLLGASSTTTGSYSLYINYSGNVGIGDISPSYTLDVAGTIRSTGITYGADHQDDSDERLKDFIQRNVDPLAIADHATLHLYDKRGLIQYGLIAQDLMQYDHRIVGKRKDKEFGHIYTLSAYTVGSIALAGVKKLNHIKADKSEVERLEEKVSELEAEVKTLRRVA